MQHRRLLGVLHPMHRPAVFFLTLALMVLTACAAPTASSPAGPSRAAPSEPAGATPSPSAEQSSLHGQLAYVDGADPQIFLLDLATGNSRQLTEMRLEHAELAASGPMRPALTCGFGPSGLTWSPDGSLLAFAYGSCDSVVYVVDLEGELRRIGDGRGPTWSHTGRRLVYSANVPYSPCGVECLGPSAPGEWELRVVDVDGIGGPLPLSADGSTSLGSQPVFSPDDAWIAFAGPPAGDDLDPETFGATYVVRADGTDARHVANGAWPAGWHPDGRLLIVAEESSETHAIDLAESTSTLIGTVQGPAGLSPDGALVLETAFDPVSGAGGIRLVTVDGDILAEAPGYPGAWAPNSVAVAIVDLAASAIVVIGSDGTTLAQYAITGSSGFTNVAWRSGS